METFEEKIQDSVYFVEANSNEEHSLWRSYKDETNWEQDMSGQGALIGNINGDEDMPVFVQFNFAKIYGKRVCLYNATSRFVDHNMVENHIKSLKEDIRLTDANNFHLAANFCKNI